MLPHDTANQVVEIPLTQGKVALIDVADYERVSKFKWLYIGSNYAARYEYKSGKRQMLYLHRYLMNAHDGIEVDHINRNRLDCRRCNMRLATRKQNQYNVGITIRNTSGYKGICFDRARNKWASEIAGIHLGRYDDPIKAARAYDAKARDLYGEYAFLNFPNETISWDEAYSKRWREKKSSQFLGVTWDRQTNKWRAQLNYLGKHINLGRFSNEIDAARIYDAKVLELFGPSGKTNMS